MDWAKKKLTIKALVSVSGKHTLCYAVKRRIGGFILEGFRFLEEIGEGCCNQANTFFNFRHYKF